MVLKLLSIYKYLIVSFVSLSSIDLSDNWTDVHRHANTQTDRHTDSHTCRPIDRQMCSNVDYRGRFDELFVTSWHTSVLISGLLKCVWFYQSQTQSSTVTSLLKLKITTNITFSIGFLFEKV